MFCTNCGTECEFKARFCHECGEALAADVGAVTTEERPSDMRMPSTFGNDPPGANAEHIRVPDVPRASDATGSAFGGETVPSVSPVRIIGLLLMIGGLLAAVYFFLFFDVSVAVPSQTLFGNTIGGGRVNNLGLMADRQNGIIFGFGAALLGGVVLMLNRGKK